MDHSTVGFKEVVGTSGEVAYALTYVGEDQYTALTFNPDFNSPQKEVDVLYKTDLALSVTYQTPFVTCVTTESPSCTANSTLCLYTDNGGEHGFHGNDFDNEGKDCIVEFIDSFKFRQHVVMVFECLSLNLYEYQKLNKRRRPVFSPE